MLTVRMTPTKSLGEYSGPKITNTINIKWEINGALRKNRESAVVGGDWVDMLGRGCSSYDMRPPGEYGGGDGDFACIVGGNACWGMAVDVRLVLLEFPLSAISACPWAKSSTAAIAVRVVETGVKEKEGTEETCALSNGEISIQAKMLID